MLQAGLTMNVPYDFKYHAEIRYETEMGFMTCNANGNTIDEILWDIDDRLDKYEHREPKVLVVYEDPNGKKIDVTEKILKRLYREAG